MIRPFLPAAMLAVASCAMPPATSTVSPALRAEFAPTGTLRAAVNFGNIVIAQKDPAGGDPRGVGPELARELARRLGVPISYVYYDNAGKVADVAQGNVWDVAFLAVDPKRSGEIAFSAPYVLIEGTYMVRGDSPLRALEDFDRKGLRISVGLRTAYDLYLTRELKQSELVRYDTSQAAIDAFIADRSLDAVAGVKNTLAANAAKNPGMRVLDKSFQVIGQASGVPKPRPQAARYLAEFIEEAKASGFVAEQLRRSGAEATVAPAAR